MYHINNLGTDLDNFQYVLTMYDFYQENHTGITSTMSNFSRKCQKLMFLSLIKRSQLNE